MLRYKILQSENSHEITLSLNTSDIDKKNIDSIEISDDVINENVSLEKESYKTSTTYKLYFKFYNNTTNSFNTDFTNAGFNMSTDINKNVFKKSLFLLEFYNDSVRKFSTTLSVYPNPRSKKGCDSVMVGDTLTVTSTFTINDVLNELYLIYNNRDFSSITNIRTDNNGKRYFPMSVKIMFLNAKTGKVHYFMADKNNSNNTLIAGDFSDSMYYQEIRFFEDRTYGFYNSELIQNNVYYKEVVIK